MGIQARQSGLQDVEINKTRTHPDARSYDQTVPYVPTCPLVHSTRREVRERKARRASAGAEGLATPVGERAWQPFAGTALLRPYFADFSYAQRSRIAAPREHNERLEFLAIQFLIAVWRACYTMRIRTAEACRA